jgi:predicted MFS family arabinose efflux permease
MPGVGTGRAGGPSAVALAVAGSAAVATAFGMARYGYGLLLPDIQDDLALRATALGAIGTLGYVAYVLATAVVTRCIARAGERATVVAGGLFAVAGTTVVALADSPPLLAAGVTIAGASAGLVHPPFADAVQRLPAAVRARTLATINCGTGWGVAVAAPIAIVAGDAWRTAYLGFAACAVLSTLHVARTLPGRRAGPALANGEPGRPGLRRAALPMLAAALLIGVGSAAFWTFAVDQVRDAGLDQAAGRALLGVAGATSLLAIGAADLIARLGAGKTFVLTALLEAAAIATIGAAADSLVAVLVAAAAFGAAYNTIVTVTVLWGTRIYSDRPSAGAATAAGAGATGLLCGPLAGGIAADAAGLTATLLTAAVIVLAAALLAPRQNMIENQTE